MTIGKADDMGADQGERSAVAGAGSSAQGTDRDATEVDDRYASEGSGDRQCGYSLCATLWPDDLIRYAGKGRKGGRPAEYHTDGRWAPEKVTCRDLGIAEQRDNRVRESVAARPEFTGRVGPAVHRPDLDTLRDLLTRIDAHVAPAVTVLGDVRVGLDTVANTLDQDTQAALRRAEIALRDQRDEQARRRRAEAAAAAAETTADAATRRANAADEARDTALKNARQAILERQTAQDLAATLAEQLDTAHDNEQKATTALATRTAERDTATARITRLETELRDQAAHHASEIDTARDHYDITLSELRAEDRAARDQLHRDLKAGYDQQLHDLTTRHDSALTQLRDQLDLARATGARADAALTQARTDIDNAHTAAVTYATHLTTLREGVLTGLASLPADDDTDTDSGAGAATRTLHRTLTALLERTKIDIAPPTGTASRSH